MHIFQDNASLYWAAGLPVIPLKRWNSHGKGAGKAPILNEWTAYASTMPTEAMRDHWLQSYPDSNIGLPFGPASGLCAIDIDSEDEAIVQAIRDALPHSPWVRIGKKGMGLIYKWQGQPNFKLRNSDNESIVEFLGQGNQMVLPPSIHPSTEKPYVSNTNLWEVLDKIQPLPTDIERVLRNALEGIVGVSLAQTGRSGPIDVVPQGERDIQMVRHAGYLARVVRGIDKNKKFTLVEAMDHMRHWVEAFTATASGDDMDPDKGVAKLIEFLLKDIEAGMTLPEGWDVGLTDEQREHSAIAEMLKKNEVQRWTVSKAQEWLEAQVAQDPDNTNWVLARIIELAELTAKDENFSEMEFKSGLVAHMQRHGKAVGLTLKVPDLKKMFTDARRGDTDIAADHEEIARIIYDEIARNGELRFAQGRFWQWNGSCFKEVHDDDIYMQIAEGVKGNVLARRHNDYVAITKTVAKIARKELAEELEDGINFANGFLDTHLQLHEHSPKYGKTFTMPFNYIPERAGEAHKWLEFLEQSWGDDYDYAEKVSALQEAMAATMFGMATQFQRAILLHGKAKTGKTQALEVLRAMMPPAASCSLPPHQWSARFALTSMVGKSLNLCGELPEAASIDGDVFKEVVEGTWQETEFKGKDRFGFFPKCANWFGSNHLPRSRDTSEGFTRRWLILEFNRVVPPEERVLKFHELLVSEEREAIAAWAVQALPRLLRQRDYTLPASHLEVINQVRRSNNSVAAFLQSNDKIRPTDNPEDTCDVRSAFDVYIWYMKDVSRGYPVSYETFTHMLRELGHHIRNEKDVLGVLRYKAEKLKILVPILPK